MKMMLVWLFLFLGCKPTQQVAEPLQPYLDEFVREASIRNINVNRTIKKRLEKMDIFSDTTIVFEHRFSKSDTLNLGKGTVGFTTEDYKNIFVLDSVLKDTLKTRIVVFHELGHFLSKSSHHCCGSCYKIMSAYVPFDASVFKNEELWNLMLNDFFHNLKIEK